MFRMGHRLEIRCLCGQLGRLTFTGAVDEAGKKICNFACSCDQPIPNYADPYLHRA